MNKQRISAIVIFLLGLLALQTALAEQVKCEEKSQAGYVTVVYSHNYQISFAGLQNLHHRITNLSSAGHILPKPTLTVKFCFKNPCKSASIYAPGP